MNRSEPAGWNHVDLERDVKRLLAMQQAVLDVVRRLAEEAGVDVGGLDDVREGT